MCLHNLFSKEVLAEIYPQLIQFRLERQLSLEELQAATHLNLKILKRVEKGKCLPFSCYRRLLKFYGKKMHIVFVDI
ncbi:MAG: hypothetical protein IJS88_00760 [Alphaproteobacteria bacterium]|nr:hypothetical protein [Alphaproteobacteria bacterium]